MDEVRRRLEFGNRNVKLQALKKLYETILTKHKGALPINESTPESAELSLLWEACANSDAVVCQGACDHVVALVKRDQAEFGFILSKLTTLASVARNHTGIITAVGDLLLLQMTETPPGNSSPQTLVSPNMKYTSPFTISVPGIPHPLITLLVDQTECWPVLLQLIERLFATYDDSRLLLMLEPFVKFVLLDPNQPSKHRPLQLALWSVFLRNVRKDKQLLQYLINLLPVVQISSGSGHLLNSLGCQMMTDGCFDLPSLTSFISQVLVMALSLADHGNDISELLRTIQELVTRKKRGLDLNLVLLHCIPLLSVSSLRCQSFCLNIVHEIISTSVDPTRLDRLVVAMLVLPLLQFLSSPDLYKAGEVLSTAGAILDAVEIYIEQGTSSSKICVDHPENLFSYPVTDGYTHQAINSLIRCLSKHPSTVAIWLRNVALSMSKEASAPPPLLVSCLVAAVLVTPSLSDIIDQSLNVLVKLCARDVTLSVQVLTLLLYKLHKTTDPKIRLNILCAIPQCATHKMAIIPILATIQTLFAHPKLRPISLRLASLLWQQQEICFMYLLQMLERSMSMDRSRSVAGGSDDVLVARASCIRDICKLSAAKHGEEMISHISAILLDCTLPEQAQAACLSLQALYHLVEAEVTDIRTVWNVLSTQLSRDQRPLVMVDVARLLSLAPDLEVETKEYQKFLGDSLSLIWRMTRHSDVRVVESAFRALAEFPSSLHTLDHFPEGIKQMQLQEMAKLVAETDEKDEDDESVVAVHGSCYARLLQSLSSDVLPGFEVFLSSLVSHESSNFPRGLTFSASQQQIPRSRGLASIPSFLHDQFESNQKPGNRSSLAVGLLFCYDDPPITGRDGKRGLKSLITRGKNYRDMLYTLINDISIELSNWYQCVVKVPAWAAFMERCFLADIECRTAELQLQLEKGECKDPAENQLYQNGAWLWCRDKLTDLIKRASRGSPAAQSNCVSALAGLALAVSSYASRLDPEALRSTEPLTEHLKQPHWFTMVAETVLTIINVGYQSRGRIFSICTQKTSNQETSATQSTVLARSSACVAVSLLLPLLATTNVEMVYTTLDLLMNLLPGKAADTVSDVLQTHSGIGLGLAVNRLLAEHFVDIAPSQGAVALWAAIRSLEESAFGSSTARSGSLVGFASCLAALCMDVRLDSRTYIKEVRARLLTALDDFKSSEKSLESLPLCLALLSGSSFVANIAAVEVVNEDCRKLEKILDENSNNAEVCRAIGTLYFILQSVNHPNMKDAVRRVSSSWKSTLQDENLGEEDKVAALTGLTSLVGCHRIVLSISDEGSGVLSEIGLEKDVIRILKSSLSSCSLNIQKTGAWLTGLLYLATADVGSRHASVPANYHVLPQTSVLRPLVDLLIEFSKKGASDIDSRVVCAVLRSMTNDGTRPFPLLNWSAILGPMLRLPLGPIVEELCLRLAIQQSAFLPNLSSFLSSCLVAPFYNGLKIPAKVCIYRNLKGLIRVIPTTVLKEYFEQGFIEPLRSLAVKGDEKPSGVEDDLWTLVMAMMGGLQMALQEPSPPQNVPSMLWQAFETVCSLCPVENARLWRLCCKCVQFAPESLMDSITAKELKHNETYLRGLLMRCYLVAIGNQPLVWLNHAIESVAYNPSISDYSPCLWMMMQAFAACRNSAISESCQPLNRMQWLLELMGHIKNLALGIVPLATEELVLSQIIRFLLAVFLSAIILWSDTSAVVLLGLPEHLIHNKLETPDAGTCGENRGEFLFKDNEGLLESILRDLAPSAVLNLFKTEPWNQLTSRLIEWFLTIYDAPAVLEVAAVRKVIRDCLLGLRHENEFKRMSVWSRVLMLT